MSKLDGTVSWVTGGGSGIGQAAAMALAEAGSHVVVTGRTLSALRDTCARIEDGHGSAEPMAGDVADKKRAADIGAQILARHGRCDILVNSAGLNITHRHYHDLVPEDWDKIISVNLNGALYCIGAVLPHMRERHSGLVINISSWAGRWISYLVGPAYAASKHALAAATHHLNLEEGMHGIRACVIYPGEVATPILKCRPKPPSTAATKRMLQVQDIGRTVRFVAEMPARVCFNEIVVSPTWNRIVLGGDEVALGPPLDG